MSVSRVVVLCFAKFKGLCLSVCKGHKTLGSEDETDAQDTGNWKLDTGHKCYFDFSTGAIVAGIHFC